MKTSARDVNYLLPFFSFIKKTYIHGYVEKIFLITLLNAGWQRFFSFREIYRLLSKFFFKNLNIFILYNVILVSSIKQKKVTGGRYRIFNSSIILLFNFLKCDDVNLDIKTYVRKIMIQIVAMVTGTLKCEKVYLFLLLREIM